MISRTVGSSEHTQLLLFVSVSVISRTVVSSEYTQLLLLVSLWFPKSAVGSEHLLL